MIEKMIHNVQDLNAAARHLRDKQQFDRIKDLAYEWLVPEDHVKDFINGKRIMLADVDVGEKEYRNAGEKLADEMHLIGDPDFADVIGFYICRKSMNKEFEALVLQPHKALQKCLDYILGKAYDETKEKHGKDGMRKQGGVGMAVMCSSVFSWVDEYYALDDAKEEAEKKEKAKQEFIENRKKAEENAKKREKEDAERKKRQEKKTQIEKSKKEMKESQMSIFDLVQAGGQKETAGEPSDSLPQDAGIQSGEMRSDSESGRETEESR